MSEPYEGIKLRPAQWEVETATRIIDPDGWREPYAKDYEAFIDYDEWSWRRAMSTVQLTLAPDTDLLPAEERLANVLKAIEARMKEEQDTLKPLGNPEIEIRKRYFIAGLEIAWSLAQTESLRRQPETQN